jgi:hypothetical protein
VETAAFEPSNPLEPRVKHRFFERTDDLSELGLESCRLGPSFPLDPFRTFVTVIIAVRRQNRDRIDLHGKQRMFQAFASVAGIAPGSMEVWLASSC